LASIMARNIHRVLVFSIVPGLYETTQLVGILDGLSSGDARLCGKAGQALVKQQNDPARVAAQLGATYSGSACCGVAAEVREECIARSAANMVLS